MNCPLLAQLSLDSWGLVLAQLTRRIDIVEPWLSPEFLTTTAWILFGLWMFALGASVGSFLNVVVYRLPEGMSLSVPGSRCPRCLSPIRLRHNIPILGWLFLRGRCADCQLPISSRYPLVELLMGLLFLVIGLLEVFGQGVNLPKPNPGSWRPSMTTREIAPLAATVTMHCLLIATLVGAALIDYDGRRIPYRLPILVILFAIGATWWWPQVHPWSAPEFPRVPVNERISDRAELGFQDVIQCVNAGLLGGALAALAFWVRPGIVSRYGGPLTLLWIAICLIFGWQLFPWLFTCWGLTFLIAVRTSPERTPQPAVGLAAVSIGALFLWRWIANYSLVFNDGTHWQLLAMAILLCLGWFSLFVASCQLPIKLEFATPASPYNSPLPAEAKPIYGESAGDPPLPADEPKPL